MTNILRLPALFTEDQVANALGISADTVRRERKSGRIGCIKIGRRKIRFTEAQINDYVNSGRIVPCHENETKEPARSENSGFLGAPTVQHGAGPGLKNAVDKHDVHLLAQRTFKKQG